MSKVLFRHRVFDHGFYAYLLGALHMGVASKVIDEFVYWPIAIACWALNAMVLLVVVWSSAKLGIECERRSTSADGKGK